MSREYRDADGVLRICLPVEEVEHLRAEVERLQEECENLRDEMDEPAAIVFAKHRSEEIALNAMLERYRRRMSLVQDLLKAALTETEEP
jgi:hypothetical protein